MKKLLLPFVLLTSLSPLASAVQRCESGGRIWYQDTVCPAGSSGTTIAPAAPLQNAPLSGSGHVISIPQEPSRPLPEPPNHLPASVYEREARLCLDWYKKQLQLPADTQYLNYTKDRRVLTITIPVRVSVVNHLGLAFNESTVNKQASCEIHNGQLDDGWTRIHAQRGGWIQ